MSQKKSLPRKTLENLQPYPTAHEFFVAAEQHPFRHHADAFELLNAWWLCEASFLAYSPEDKLRRQWQRVSFDCTVFDRDSTQAYIAHDDRVAIAAFRGTRITSLRAFITDMTRNVDTRLVEADRGRVHAGFNAALDEVWNGPDNIEQYLVDLRERFPDLTFWFTGHSLGGALATLAASRFSPVRAVYTFGAPRVGNEAFVRSFSTAMYRFVNGDDVVPALPPSVDIDIPFVDQYRQFEDLKLINAGGELVIDPSAREDAGEQGRGVLDDLARIWSEIQNGDLDTIPFDALADHAPILYAVHIWNNYLHGARTA